MTRPGVHPPLTRREQGRVRVLHVITRDQRRGAETAAVELAGVLRARGLRTDLVALAPGDDSSTFGVRVLGSRSLGPRTLWRLRRAIRVHDVVVAHGSRTLPAVALAGVFTGRALVYQNIGDPRFWTRGRLRRARVRVLLHRMDCVVALTETARAIIEERFGLPPDRVTVIRNWRDSGHYRPPEAGERARARDALELEADDDCVVVSVIGALSTEKDVTLALRVMHLLPEGWHLVVAGDGPERAALQNDAERLAPGRVTFLGSVDSSLPVLHASDVLLLTSRSEGVPGVLIEAGLCAVPAVTVDVGFVAEVVDDAETGYVVRSREPADIAAALRAAWRDRTMLGALAREQCVERFDSAGVAGDWQSVLAAVAARRSP